ncbi:MAG: hypothetical protein KJ887_01180 [Candidatus Omnitrophica bacterium]|nr:hypothetical protein [Candidatus Omnitrophota bacterium]MBU1047270.1 hypothetical protein [Candidatus Omnitrophota bacterium]MBU1630994.1 hypothetical protein [Candidatus Omnitrophota bacterium]MBU1889145.1 hypothetical protein [Candidatus Omnitrophota bacterium]
MSNGVGGAGAASYYAAIANAIKASGTIVQVGPEDFQKILMKAEKPLVVYAKGNFFTGNHQYITSYKGLAFFVKSKTELMLSGAEIIKAKSIWIPT